MQTCGLDIRLVNLERGAPSVVLGKRPPKEKTVHFEPLVMNG